MDSIMDTTAYDSFFSYAKTRLACLSETEMAKLAARVVSLLLPGPAGAGQPRFSLLPPGKLAHVIRVHSGCPIGNALLAERKAALGIAEIGVKLYKKPAPTIVDFQRLRARAGKPHQHSPRIQRVVDASELKDADGGVCHCVVLECIEGKTLVEMHGTAWSATTPLKPDPARQLLIDLLTIVLEIVVESPPDAAIVWDYRDGNFVVTPDGRLTLIDSCSLLAGDPHNRSGQEQDADGRIRNISARILGAVNGRSAITNLKNLVDPAWSAFDIAALLHELGLVADPTSQVVEAARKQLSLFVDALL